MKNESKVIGKKVKSIETDVGEVVITLEDGSTIKVYDNIYHEMQVVIEGKPNGESQE